VLNVYSLFKINLVDFWILPRHDMKQLGRIALCSIFLRSSDRSETRDLMENRAYTEVGSAALSDAISSTLAFLGDKSNFAVHMLWPSLA
jgi:predicted acetyltransferase